MTKTKPYFETSPDPYLHFDHAKNEVRWQVTKRFRKSIRKDLETLDRVQELKSMFFVDVNEVVQQMLRFHPYGGR